MVGFEVKTNVRPKIDRAATLIPQPEASTSGSIAPVSVEERATSRSYMRWRFSQNSGVMLSALPMRRAVSAVMDFLIIHPLLSR